MYVLGYICTHMNYGKLILAAFMALLFPALGRGAGLDAGALDSVRGEVWRLWTQTVASDSLPALAPLGQAGAQTWTLPDSLEPAADMAFYYGTKGSARQYPLYLYLHGSGPRELEWATGLKLALRFDDAPAAYFIPRIPNEGEWYRWYQRSKQWAFERVLRQALASGSIDPDRIYLMGISEGGYGSQRLASFYADYLAAAGPMAGGEPLRNAPVENLRNTAFSLRTGADDNGFYRDRLTAATARALDSVAAASPGDYLHWVELIPGRGHHIDYAPTPKWLGSHVRRLSPRRVTWEDFAMDGRHRSGFGNLQVIERPEGDPEARTRYDFSVEDNTVRLDARSVSYETTERDPYWGIELSARKSYEPVTSGRLRVYIDENMVDFSRPVIVIVNGRERFNGLLELTRENIERSCREFFDPRRLFPASVEVDFGAE